MKWIFFLFIAFIGIINGKVYSQNAAAPINVTSERIALGGYDPVSYFNGKNPAKGKSFIAAEYSGAIYRFATESNKKLFLASPASYLPQYGGWCAYAMGATGEKVEVDPETYKVTDGKLYLFYNRFFNNTRDTWNKDETKLKASADKNWQKIISR